MKLLLGTIFMCRKALRIAQIISLSLGLRDASAVELVRGSGNGFCAGTPCYRAAGIIPWPDAKGDALRGDWHVEPVSGPDRYGRPAARFTGPAGDSLATRLVAEGLALADALSSPDEIAPLLAAERRAERQRQGLWAAPPVWQAGSAPVGEFGFLDGILSRIEPKGGHLRLILTGPDGTATGFIPASVAGRFDRHRLDEMTGHRVRLRGWMERRRFGPDDAVGTVLLRPYAIQPVK